MSVASYGVVESNLQPTIITAARILGELDDDAATIGRNERDSIIKTRSADL